MEPTSNGELVKLSAPPMAPVMSPVGVHHPVALPGADLLNAMSASAVKARVQAIQGVMAAVMKEEVHYGVVPGSKKPSLYKPGAEVLCMTFSLSPRITARVMGDHPDIPYHWKDRKKEWFDGPNGRTFDWLDEEGDTYGYFEIVAVCDIFGPDGRLLASCEGSCNNREKKYRTLNVYEVRNTVMKMAGKRAFVAATLMATGASDMFTQDLEDSEDAAVERAAQAQGGKAKTQTQTQTQGAPSGWLSEAQGKLLFVKGKAAGVDNEVVEHVKAELNAMGKQKGKPYFDAIADGKPEAMKFWEKAKTTVEAKKKPAEAPAQATTQAPAGDAPAGDAPAPEAKPE